MSVKNFWRGLVEIRSLAQHYARTKDPIGQRSLRSRSRDMLTFTRLRLVRNKDKGSRTNADMEVLNVANTKELPQSE